MSPPTDETTAHLQQLDLGKTVELFELDYSMLPGAPAPPDDVIYFTSSVVAGDYVVFGGKDYTPAPIEAEGFDRSTQGTLPQPRLRVGNASDILASLVYTHDDLLGSVLTRTLVYERFLDGEPDADVNAWHRRDVFVVEQLAKHNPIMLEFVLASPLDQEGRPIPRRSMLKRTCPREYRRWNGSTFDSFTESGGCPWDGGPFYFKANGDLTLLESEDKCGKSLADCRLRYPKETAPALPFGAFPGIGDAR